ncbi:hypothetical protein [uncultured Mediterranean phage]|nr:hypothetical protein [uncultured Mediterranean phage]
MCVPAVFVAMSGGTMAAGTAATLAAVSQVGLILGGTMMSVNAQKQAMAYQQMQYASQQQAYKNQADSAALETLMLENDRKRKYMSQISTNRALLSVSGTTQDSASYRAFFKAGKEVVKKDLEKIKLMGAEKRLASLYGVQQAGLAGKAASSAGKASIYATYGRGLMATYRTAKEFRPKWFEMA